MERLFHKEKTRDWIVLEGIDGVGKSTLAQRVIEQMPLVRVFEEPHGTVGGRAVAELIDSDLYNADAHILFFGGLVSTTIEKHINPALQMGRKVISVRSFPSTLAYQGTTPEKTQFIADMYSYVLRDQPAPAVVLVTCDFEESIKRTEARDGVRPSLREINRLEEVCNRYYQMADKFGWEVLGTNTDVNKSVESLVKLVNE